MSRAPPSPPFTVGFLEEGLLNAVPVPCTRRCTRRHIPLFTLYPFWFGVCPQQIINLVLVKALTGVIYLLIL